MGKFGSQSSNMIGKFGSGFKTMQKTVGPGSTASPMRKWGTRTALGIGAIGALALGADVMDGSLFDGDGGFGGGSGLDGDDFDGGSGEYGDGDMATRSDANTSLNANTAYNEMAAQGRENALQLLDPVGTEYQVVDGNGLI